MVENNSMTLAHNLTNEYIRTTNYNTLFKLFVVVLDRTGSYRCMSESDNTQSEMIMQSTTHARHSDYSIRDATILTASSWRVRAGQAIVARTISSSTDHVGLSCTCSESGLLIHLSRSDRLRHEQDSE